MRFDFQQTPLTPQTQSKHIFKDVAKKYKKKKDVKFLASEFFKFYLIFVFFRLTLFCFFIFILCPCNSFSFFYRFEFMM